MCASALSNIQVRFAQEAWKKERALKLSRIYIYIYVDKKKTAEECTLWPFLWLFREETRLVCRSGRCHERRNEGLRVSLREKITDDAARDTLRHEMRTCLNRFWISKKSYTHDIDLVYYIGDSFICAICMQSGQFYSQCSVRKWCDASINYWIPERISLI